MPDLIVLPQAGRRSLREHESPFVSAQKNAEQFLVAATILGIHDLHPCAVGITVSAHSFYNAGMEVGAGRDDPQRAYPQGPITLQQILPSLDRQVRHWLVLHAGGAQERSE